MNRTILAITISILLQLTISSCKTKHDLTIFDDLQQTQSGLLASAPYNTRLEPENELVITVNSEVPEATAEFNLPYTNPAVSGSKELTSTQQLQTYVVDQRGNIDFPKLGTIHVAGMTQLELKDYLTQRISESVKDPIVTVQLLGYSISVLGEVNAPHVITTNAERYNILDALSECGGLSDFALRDNILVMRRNADNQIEYNYLNLHDSNITQSPYFWLKNNDVVIVSPNNVKQDNSKFNQNNSYKLTVVSTVVSVTSVIASLVIALTVK